MKDRYLSSFLEVHLTIKVRATCFDLLLELIVRAGFWNLALRALFLLLVLLSLSFDVRLALWLL